MEFKVKFKTARLKMMLSQEEIAKELEVSFASVESSKSDNKIEDVVQAFLDLKILKKRNGL